MRRVGAAAVAVLVLGFAASPAPAEHLLLHREPQGPAKANFAPDFPELADHEWGFRMGGFGGIERGAPLNHVPVIFVHGNTADHSDWYPVQDLFREAGWTDQELWALAYNGLGGSGGGGPNPRRVEEHNEMGSDGQGRTTNNDLNVPDLHDFILAVRDYTGSEKFSIVSHSLGVTVARKTLKVHPELREDLVAFVGIAGGNHGTSLCPPGTEAHVHSCDELAADGPWLEELNGPDGEDETYPPARWVTYRDSTGVLDVAFLGPYQDSPMLKGADNRAFVAHHNDLRLNPEIVADYRAFLEEAEQPYLVSSQVGAEVRETRQARAAEVPSTPATGTGRPAAAAVGLLLIATVAAVARRRILA